MFKRFLKYLESKGRRVSLVDFYGNVLFNRWCLFYPESPEVTSFWPNLYIQNFVGTWGLDGPLLHTHPWAAIGVIVKGGYTENWNGKMRERRAGNIHLSTRKDFHGIAKSIPNSWTLFFHWFRTGPWKIVIPPCEVVCPTCLSTTGQCERLTTDYLPEEIIDGIDTAVKWRSPRWVVMTPLIHDQIRRRKKAAAKLNLHVYTEVNDLAAYKFNSQ